MTDSKRTLTAVLISPVLIPVGVLAIALLDGVRLRESIVVAGIYAAFTYSGTVLLGLPIHVVLDRSGLRGLIHYTVAGAVAAGAILVAFIAAKQNVAIGFNTVAVFGSAGAVTAAAFWGICVR